MMSQLESIAACFPVPDIETTIRWYEDNLEFEGDPFPPNGPYVFAILRRDDVEIMLQWEFEMKDPNGYVLVFSEFIRAD